MQGNIYLAALCTDSFQYFSNRGTTNPDESKGFIFHRSWFSKGFRKPNQASLSNQLNVILDKNDEVDSGHMFCKIQY